VRNNSNFVSGARDLSFAFLAKVRSTSHYVPMGEKQAALVLDAWKKTVDVQQHFNHIEMDIRKTAVTLVGGAIGAAAVVADRSVKVTIDWFEIPATTCILLAGCVAWAGFAFMDYGWYHRLLKGAVVEGQHLEKELLELDVPVTLTRSIGEHSPLRF